MYGIDVFRRSVNVAQRRSAPRFSPWFRSCRSAGVLALLGCAVAGCWACKAPLPEGHRTEESTSRQRPANVEIESDSGGAPAPSAGARDEGGPGTAAAGASKPGSASDVLRVPFSLRRWERRGESTNDAPDGGSGHLYFSRHDVLFGVARTEAPLPGCGRTHLSASLTLLDKSVTESTGPPSRARLRLALDFAGEGGLRRVAEVFAEVALGVDVDRVVVERGSPWAGAVGGTNVVTLVRSTRHSAGCDFVLHPVESSGRER